MSCLSFVGLVASLLLASAHLVGAAEVEADLKGFCKEKYGQEAFPGVDQRDNLLCSQRTAGGLGLLHHKIKPADVCAAQRGTRRYRREAKKLLCLTDASDKAARAGKVIDLEKHCKAAYGPDAKMSRRLTDNRPMCTVPTHGGLGLTHHLIDLAELCGRPAQKVEGTILHCGGQPSATAPPSEKETARPPRPRRERATVPGAREAPAGTPELTDQAEVAMRPAKGKLEGCGLYGINVGVYYRHISDPGGRGYEYGRIPFPCPELTGGWKVDLRDTCGAAPVVIGEDGSPKCRLQYVDQTVDQPIQLTLACYKKFRKLTGKELHASPELLGAGTSNELAWRWHDGQLHCFLVPKKAVKCYQSFLAEGSYPPGCLTVDPSEIHFVEAEPPYDVIEVLTVGRPFRVKLVFDTDPGRTTAPVTVTNERSGQTLELVAEQTDDPRIFRTPPVDLLPEVTP